MPVWERVLWQCSKRIAANQRRSPIIPRQSQIPHKCTWTTSSWWCRTRKPGPRMSWASYIRWMIPMYRQRQPGWSRLGRVGGSSRQSWVSLQKLLTKKSTRYAISQTTRRSHVSRWSRTRQGSKRCQVSRWGRWGGEVCTDIRSRHGWRKERQAGLDEKAKTGNPSWVNNGEMNWKRKRPV